MPGQVFLPGPLLNPALPFLSFKEKARFQAFYVGSMLSRYLGPAEETGNLLKGVKLSVSSQMGVRPCLLTPHCLAI